MRAVILRLKCRTSLLTRPASNAPSVLVRNTRRSFSGGVSVQAAYHEGGEPVSRAERSSVTPDRTQLFDGNHVLLRDSCLCSLCIDQSTKQREFSFADIPADIQGFVEQRAPDEWLVRWKNDIPGFENHVSVFNTKSLRYPSTGRKHLLRLPRSRLWDRSKFESEKQTVTYDEFLHQESGLVKVLFAFAQHGLVFISDVPRETEAVSAMARRIGPLRNSFYGETWDVRSVPQAKNVAYTSKYLGFHMDLLYMVEPPGGQLLHCLENTCSGGESRFVDTFKALDVLCSEDPSAFDELKNLYVQYEYDNDGQYFAQTRPVIDKSGPGAEHKTRRVTDFENKQLAQVARVFWSPPFVGAFESHRSHRSLDSAPKRLAASRKFAGILERKDLVYEDKLKAGTCAIFDNLRVLHARNAFDINSGSRWLRGAYLDGQDIRSRTIGLVDAIRATAKDQY